MTNDTIQCCVAVCSAGVEPPGEGAPRELQEGRGYERLACAVPAAICPGNTKNR